jgi:hypothetical protein
VLCDLSMLPPTALPQVKVSFKLPLVYDLLSFPLVCLYLTKCLCFINFFFKFRDTLERVLRAVSAVVMSVVSIGRRPAEVSFVRWPFFADLSVLYQVSA